MESGLYQMGGELLDLTRAIYLPSPRCPLLTSTKQGAILNSVPKDDDPASLDMAGSTVVIVAESKEEIVDVLKKDIYATSGVWDVDSVRQPRIFLASMAIDMPTGSDVAAEVRLQDSRQAMSRPPQVRCGRP